MLDLQSYCKDRWKVRQVKGMRQNFWKKYIGDKAFYRMVLLIVVPVIIQNGITNFVSLLDNIMVGQVGTEQMSGVAIVNQFMTVFNICIFGGVSSAGIFTAAANRIIAAIAVSMQTMNLKRKVLRTPSWLPFP